VVGDYLLVSGAEGVLTRSAVISIKEVVREGIFAPGTLHGNIMVDGVVTSSYSKWVLEDLFGWAIPSTWFAALNHAFFKPFQVLYTTVLASFGRQVTVEWSNAVMEALDWETIHDEEYNQGMLGQVSSALSPFYRAFRTITGLLCEKLFPKVTSA